MMDQPPAPARKPRKRINYALAATLVTSGMSLAEAAAQCGAKTSESLRVGLFRRGVTPAKARALQPMPARIQSITQEVATRASEIIRDTLGRDLQATADNVSKLPTRGFKALKQRVEVLEPLARTAKIVHRWDDNDRPTINLNLVTDTKLADLPVIDVDPLPVGQKQLNEPEPS